MPWALTAVLLGLGGGEKTGADPFIAASLAALPVGTYWLEGGFHRPDLAALSVALGGYSFTPKPDDDAEISLVVPTGVDGAELRRTVSAVTLARDLINTPANRMGPANLAAEAAKLAADNGADMTVTVGEELLAKNFPMVHAVGAAAAPGREPRLVDLVWGDPKAPKVTLVGKGVCFDTGGLDIKTSTGMRLMKKDMGGAANARRSHR